MEAFLVSAGVVALAEIGDKTQLLALLLTARFRAPWPIALGILVSTVANHALARRGWRVGGRTHRSGRAALDTRTVVPGDGGLDADSRLRAG